MVWSKATGIAVLVAMLLATGIAGAGQGVQVAESTTEGVFEGTWIYENRDLQMALWLILKSLQ